MRSRLSNHRRTHSTDDRIATEATEWLVRLLDHDFDPEEPFPDPLERQNAFFDWVSAAPAHTRAFLQILDIERRVAHPDPQRAIKLQELLEATSANVIPLPHARGGSPATSDTSSRIAPVRKSRVLTGTAAAAACLLIAAALFYFGTWNRNVFSTGVGEQHTWTLRDGSVVILNTDTRIRVDFSNTLRTIHLIKGEALFIVEHDPQRPFIVNVGSTNIRAVGTEFNVRRLKQSTEIAVVEGVVQVSTDETPVLEPTRNSARSTDASPQESALAPGRGALLRLAAGETAQVSHGEMTKSAAPDMGSMLLWRQRRLDFRNARLADIAAEFNRYNSTQIRVEGTAQDMKLTGVYDADRPDVIVKFARKIPSLSVESKGDNWVIRSLE